MARSSPSVDGFRRRRPRLWRFAQRQIAATNSQAPTSFTKRSQVLIGLAAVFVFFDCHVRHLTRSGILGTRAKDGSAAEQEHAGTPKPRSIGFLSGAGDSGSEANAPAPQNVDVNAARALFGRYMP